MDTVFSIRDARALGAAIRTERKVQGLRQDELALAAGTGRRFIGELENGKPTARLGQVLDVVAALGLEIELIARDQGRGGDQGA